MSPSLRKLVLMLHVGSSVGWLGAVGVYLAIAIVAFVGEDALTVRGAYLVMDRAAWLTLLPLSVASFLTGIVGSLGTPWGLFRHYWVVFKLLMNVFATVVLVEYMPTFRAMASVAADPTVDLAMVKNPSPIIHAALALVLLLVAMVLGVYKPRGMTRYGQRAQMPVPSR